MRNLKIDRRVIEQQTLTVIISQRLLVPQNRQYRSAPYNSSSRRHLYQLLLAFQEAIFTRLQRFNTRFQHLRVLFGGFDIVRRGELLPIEINAAPMARREVPTADEMSI